MSFENQMEEAEKHVGASDWYKFKEGDNVIRILTEPVMIYELFKVGICYTNCGYSGTPKGLARVWDYADSKLKLMKIPFIVCKSILEYKQDEDSGFETFPMPYDLKIKAKNAGTKEVTYTIILKKESKVPSEATEAFEKEKPVEEVVSKMKEKQKQRVESGEVKLPNSQPQTSKGSEAIDYPDEDINPEDILF